MGNGKGFATGAIPALALGLVLVLFVSVYVQPGQGAGSPGSVQIQKPSSSNVTGNPSAQGPGYNSSNTTYSQQTLVNLKPTQGIQSYMDGAGKGILSLSPLSIDLVYVVLIALLAGLAMFAAVRRIFVEEP
jgi:hypothetical protein